MERTGEDAAKLWSMIKDIRVAMMTSWDGEQLHARPMYGHQEEFSGKLYFFTRIDSGKAREIDRFDKINLAYADVADNTYVSISGEGRVSTDKARMKEYWSPMASAWFPGGIDDPQLALIEVSADTAQYWDMTSSGMRYLWEVARANVTGRPPELGDSGKIDLTAQA